MRVLLALHHFADRNSGAAGTTLRLGDALQAVGCDVRYAFYGDVFGRHTESRTSLMKYPWALARFLKHLENEWRPDVVDAGTGDAWVAMMSRRKERPVYISRSHGLEPLHFRSLRLSGERLSLRARTYFGGYRLLEVSRSIRHADHVVVPNQTEAEYVRTHYGVPDAQISVIAYPIGNDFFDPRPDHDLSLAKVISVGNLNAIKGGVDLSEAASSIATSCRFTLTIAGCAPGFAGERELRRSLGERLRHVAEAGNRQIAGLLDEHNILVCASRSEGVPLNVFEAAARGLAIVSTGVGAVTDCFQDGVNALIVPAGRPALLADALRRVIDDQTLREALCAGSPGVAAPYRADAVARQTLDVYEKALARRFVRRM